MSAIGHISRMSPIEDYRLQKGLPAKAMSCKKFLAA
jgi:hypothetical protein